MTTTLERMGRAELLHRIADLEADLLAASNLETEIEIAQETARHASRECQEHIDHVVKLHDTVAGLKLRIRNLENGEEYRLMAENLANAQAAGSSLQDEARSLRCVLRDRLSVPTLMGAELVQRSEQFQILIDLLKVRWKGDAKYGTAEAHADLPLHVRTESDDIVLCRDGTSLALDLLRAKKKAGGNHSTWVDVLAEEVLELNLELLADSVDEDRVEAEAIDVANVALKMVEAIRIRRARTEAK